MESGLEMTTKPNTLNGRKDMKHTTLTFINVIEMLLIEFKGKKM